MGITQEEFESNIVDMTRRGQDTAPEKLVQLQTPASLVNN